MAKRREPLFIAEHPNRDQIVELDQAMQSVRRLQDRAAKALQAGHIKRAEHVPVEELGAIHEAMWNAYRRLLRSY